MTQHLPNSDQLNIAALSGLFRSTTNSYKYLFFFSLLALLKDRKFEIDGGILLRDIEIEMLITAWYPRVFFKLSFGIQDKISSVLKPIPHLNKDKNLLSKKGRQKLREHIMLEYKNFNDKLIRYVPYRILRPFFAAETRGMPDHKVNREVSKLAVEQFHERCPLFRFDGCEECIFLHPDWIAYLQQHQTIIEGWALWHWADYMQRRNPSIPAVMRKLFPPEQRDSLNTQRKFWDAVIDKTAIQCIYTKNKLDSGYDLDHFLPWKFVMHDQLWNLIPVDPRANRSKSDRFPSERYIDCLSKTQCDALSIARDIFNHNKWKKDVEPYRTDLHIDKPEDTLNFEILRFAYRRTLEPLMSIAEQQGFHCGWTYG